MKDSYITKNIIVCLLAGVLTACAGSGSESVSTSAPSEQAAVTDSSDVIADVIVDIEVTDTDGDGLDDARDQWPTDSTKPVISKLWGVDGEAWTPQSRLPLVVFSGYQEGKGELPFISRVVANVLNFGATNTDGSSDDTQAFIDAINSASSQVSKNNPGVILVPAGVYDLSEQLHLNKSGLVFQGESRELTTVRFTTGLINSTTAIGSDARRRKLIVMGGNFDQNNKFRAGSEWAFLKSLDTDNLPLRGDFSIRLNSPLNTENIDALSKQNNRIKLQQFMNYGESSQTPEFAEAIYGSANFAAPGSNGGIWVTQQFVVSVADDKQTLNLDRPLRFSPSAESQYGIASVRIKTEDSVWGTEEIGLENMTIELPATDWLNHFGTEGQGGIEILSDNSWVKMFD